jgi:hypothetical protein
MSWFKNVFAQKLEKKAFFHSKHFIV